MNEKSRILRTLAASGGEVEGFSFSTILEASIVSIVIGSFGRSADEGLVGADSNAWDISLAPRAN